MSLNGYTILVTEDEPDERAFLTTILEDGGATVLEANNGNEAVHMAENRKPDLITLDISMPGMDITEVLAKIASSEVNGLKVCIISGRPELRGVLKDLSPVPIAGFVDKPFTEDSVLKTVREILAA